MSGCGSGYNPYRIVFSNLRGVLPMIPEDGELPENHAYLRTRFSNLSDRLGNVTEDGSESDDSSSDSDDEQSDNSANDDHDPIFVAAGDSSDEEIVGDPMMIAVINVIQAAYIDANFRSLWPLVEGTVRSWTYEELMSYHQQITQEITHLSQLRVRSTNSLDDAALYDNSLRQHASLNFLQLNSGIEPQSLSSSSYYDDDGRGVGSNNHSLDLEVAIDSDNAAAESFSYKLIPLIIGVVAVTVDCLF